MDGITLIGDYTWGYFSIMALFAICHFIYITVYKKYKTTLFGNVASLLGAIFFAYLVFTPIVWCVSLFLVGVNSNFIIESYMMVILSIASWAVIFLIPLFLFMLVLNILFSGLAFLFIAIENFFKK